MGFTGLEIKVKGVGPTLVFLYIWFSWTGQCFKGWEILNITGLGGNKTSV